MVTIGAQSGRGLAINSENRDTPFAKPIREAADNLDKLLASQRAMEIIRRTGLDTARGPYRLPQPFPSKESCRLAAVLVVQSLKPLQQAFGNRGRRTLWDGSVLQAPTETGDGAGAGIGLPLLGTCSPDTLYAILAMLEARTLPRFDQIHDNLAVRLTHYLRVEDDLWKLAADRGGPSRQIPYAYRYAATEWLWNPDVHRYKDASAICLRCGLIFRPRRPPKAGAPRCPNCAQERPEARRWPDHAIAPAGRGTWWLRCLAQDTDCLGAFIGFAQRKRCAKCRSSSTTPSKRHPLEA
ncbi:MAG: hypothetical protein ABSB24_02825 [Gaiellaceae bacterium]